MIFRMMFGPRSTLNSTATRQNAVFQGIGALGQGYWLSSRAGRTNDACFSPKTGGYSTNSLA